LRRKTSIFYSALMLTAVHLLLRFVGTGFQVYLSGRIGAAGIGLLQLTMSVGSLAMVAAIAGIRTTAMYLTAEELGKGTQHTIPWVLSGCFRYSLITGTAVAAVLMLLAPYAAKMWIGDRNVVHSIRLLGTFLPVNCLCGVMTGYFTAANRIRTLAAVEVAEQLFSMTITMLALTLRAGTDPARACESVILGSGMGSCMTLGCLVLLRRADRCVPGPRIPIASRLTSAAIPLALADILKSGITTLENLMVPKRLAGYIGISQPLAAFGIVSGMVFPVLMFPACILFALADLLIPELARCAASGKNVRIRYLVRKGLKAALLYGLLFGGILYLSAPELCRKLYKSVDAGYWLRRYALLIPMLYCDALVDAMTKGLGQQKICVRYNILTSSMDVALLYLLLPKYGMAGYFASFVITHLINFVLSLRLLIRITGIRLPGIHVFLGAAAALPCAAGAGLLESPGLRIGAYLSMLGTILWWLGVVSGADQAWLKRIIRGDHHTGVRCSWR